MKSISNNNIFATIVAFYLSKFNDHALKKLGYKTYASAFIECGKLLDVKSNYIKLRRDEFDPVYNWRKGWRNRPMAKMVSDIITLFDNLTESEMYAIVTDILHHRNTNEYKQIIQSVEAASKQNKRAYIPRAITGKLAENLFEEDFKTNLTLPKGELKDCRDNGCGYDYEILSQDGSIFYIEVKGLANDGGGILFTSKEWNVALEKLDKYYPCIVKNVNDAIPTIQYIRNPSYNLIPSKNINTIVQISYSVTEKDLIKCL